MRASTLACSLAGLAFAGTALAADGESGRYTMTPTEGGVLRLDTKTGVVALCTRKEDTGRWSCEDVDDSQRTLREENERLEAENKALKDHADHLEGSLGLGEDQGDPNPSTKFALPSEQDVDKAFDYFETMLKKLHERIEKLKKENEHGDGTAL